MVWGDARRKVSQGFSCFSCRCSLRPILGPIYGISKDIKQSSIYNRYSYVQLKMGPLFLPHSPEVMPCDSEPVSESLWASWVMMAGDTGRLQDGHGAQRCPILDFNKHLCVCILLYCPPKGKNALKETSESCGLPAEHQWDPGIFNANEWSTTICPNAPFKVWKTVAELHIVSEIPWFHVTSDSKMRKAREWRTQKMAAKCWDESPQPGHTDHL